MKYEIHLKSGPVVWLENHVTAGGLTADFENHDTAGGNNPIPGRGGANGSRLSLDLRQVEALRVTRN